MLVKNDKNELNFSSEKATLTFNKTTGFITTYNFNGQEILKSGSELRPNFWRAPVDNDYGAGLQNKLEPWKEAMKNPELKSFSHEIKGGKASVAAVYRLAPVNADLLLNYTVNSEGELKVDFDLQLNNPQETPMLFRVGMKMVLPENYDSVQYYGRGPVENYADRKEAALIKIYDQTVEEQFYPYIRPQETGNKSDVRWLDLSNERIRLHVTANAPFNFTALHYTMEDLDDGEERDQRHIAEEDPTNSTRLFIDTAQMGLGSINSWGQLPLEKYRLTGEQYRYSFKVSPQLK